MPRMRSHPTEVVARPPEGGTTRRRKRSRWRRLWHRVRWPLLALGVLVVVAAIDGVVRYLPAVLALQHGRNEVAQAQTLLTGDLAHLDQTRVAQARTLLADAELDFGSRSAVLAGGGCQSRGPEALRRQAGTRGRGRHADDVGARAD
jgi:hypothetical protein